MHPEASSLEIYISIKALELIEGKATIFALYNVNSTDALLLAASWMSKLSLKDSNF